LRVLNGFAGFCGAKLLIFFVCNRRIKTHNPQVRKDCGGSIPPPDTAFPSVSISMGSFAQKKIRALCVSSLRWTLVRKIPDWDTTLILGVHSSGLKRVLLYFFQMCVGGGPTLVSVEVFHVF
jgi:hypothetical protein